MITVEVVRSLLRYDPVTGVFTWRERSVEYFRDTKQQTASHSCAIWNGKYSGTTAGRMREDGYWEIRILGRFYRGHRLAWFYVTGEWPGDEIDHRDLDSSNNRWANLREATSSQNKANNGIRSNNRSGFKGAAWERRSKKWRACIRVNRKTIHLGYFDAAEEAHAAYCAAAEKYFGEFARAA
jgi:hypothetical protein